MHDPQRKPGDFESWFLAQGKDRLCIISPHLDDAVYSAYAAITGLPFVRKEILTVITEPNPAGSAAWAAAAGFPSTEDEFRARRLEDRAALSALSVPFRHLGAREGDVDDIRRVLHEALVSKNGVAFDSVLLIPSGAGTRATPGALRRMACRLRRRPVGSAAHPEHLLVRDIAVAALRTVSNARFGFYAEQPYRWNDTPGRITGELEEILSRPVRLVSCTVDAPRKSESALLYSSQAPLILGTRKWYQTRILAKPEEYFLVG